ncbi:hypothetical protein PanWU01x14_362380 [Parasponia andersonii]|uniref:Uncharacterized protein n=1 Tax=Parasponia andersonii TaxID=3476 RepID=A0A2P5A710_PARAD|nr:hypothetical protein PanWU01x14_362380 [Parasponia andersonii]
MVQRTDKSHLDLDPKQFTFSFGQKWKRDARASWGTPRSINAASLENQVAKRKTENSSEERQEQRLRQVLVEVSNTIQLGSPADSHESLMLERSGDEEPRSVQQIKTTGSSSLSETSIFIRNKALGIQGSYSQVRFGF